MGRQISIVHLGLPAMASAMALVLAGCGGSGTTRIASIGSVPDAAATSDAGGGTGGGSGGGSGGGGSGNGNGSSGGTGGGSGPGGGTPTLAGPILVTAGNAVIGLGDKHAGLAGTINGKLPATGAVTGTVTAVLRKTGQTLVDLGNGRSAVLNTAGGVVGKLVTIDLGSGRVVGAPGQRGLIGVAALTPTQLVQAGVANPAGGGKLGAVGGTVGTIATTATGLLTGGQSGGGAGAPVTVVGGVVGKVQTATGGLLGGTGGTAPQGVGVTGLVGAGLTGVVKPGGAQAGAKAGGLLKLGRKP